MERVQSLAQLESAHDMLKYQLTRPMLELRNADHVEPWSLGWLSSLEIGRKLGADGSCLGRCQT